MCLNSTWLAQQETPGQVFWHAKHMLASAMLISKAVCFAQINLRGEFAFGCTLFYAQIMCTTLGQTKDWKKEKEVWCVLNGFCKAGTTWGSCTYIFSSHGHNNLLRYGYDPHFTGRETETRAYVIRPHSQSRKWESSDVSPSCLNLKAVFSSLSHTALMMPFSPSPLA